MPSEGGDIPRGHLNIIDELLSGYELERTAVEHVAASVLNRNYRVETAAGPRFVRLHATRRDRARIEREHRVAEWAAGRGVPAAVPLRDRDGCSLHRIGGVFASLYPWIDGYNARRGAISDTEAATLGATLGGLHAVLRDYDDPTLESNKAGSTWDTAGAIEALSRVDDLIRYYPSPPEHQLRAQEALRHQLGLLEGDAPEPAATFADLRRQPCHGDFHERNVILRSDGSVAAVVDWEIVSLLPPVFELVRAVTLLGLLEEGAPLEAFLRSYRARVPLDLVTCRRGVEMRWQATLHDSWVYRAVFIEGNARAAQFFGETDAAVRRFSDPRFREDLARRLAAR